MAASLSPSGIASIHLFKAAVLGYTNAANASLRVDSCVSGISFKSLLPLVHMKAGGKPSGLPPALWKRNQVLFEFLFVYEVIVLLHLVIPTSVFHALYNILLDCTVRVSP